VSHQKLTLPIINTWEIAKLQLSACFVRVDFPFGKSTLTKHALVIAETVGKHYQAHSRTEFMKQIFSSLLILMIFSCNVSKEYYENGKIEKKGKISNQKKVGEWKYYHSSGKYQGGGIYLNGKRNGEWKWFHENGKLHQIGQFIEDEQTGEWNFFHPNGNRQGIGTLINGQRIGIWKWYFNNGHIQTERKWNDGKLIEIISCYDGKGNKMDKGTLTNGNGTMKLYDIDGKLLETSIYKNGEYIK